MALININNPTEIISKILEGHAIIDIAGPHDEICDYFNTIISGGEVLHSDVNKKVIALKTVKGKKKYVAKMENFPYKLNKRNVDPAKFIQSVSNPLIPNSVAILKSYNKKVDFTSNILTDIYIPSYLDHSCLLIDTQTYKSIPYGKDVIVPKSSYLCNYEIISEYAISSILGKEYRDGNCINFFDVYSFFGCEGDEDWKGRKTINYIILMDRLDGGFKDNATCISAQSYIGNLPDNLIHTFCDGIFIQMMCAIAFYHTKYQISHNDLHMGNIFLEYVRNNTTFAGQRLIDNDWYHYCISDKGEILDIYLPAIPVIVKIGDFGLSVKYSNPIIGNKDVFVDGIDMSMDRDVHEPSVPNIFIPQYDSVQSVTDFYNFLSQLSWDIILEKDEDLRQKLYKYSTQEKARKEILRRSKLSDLLNDSLSYLMNRKNLGAEPIQTLIDEEMVNYDLGYRPYVYGSKTEKLFEYKTALNLLQSDIIQKRYGEKPSNGRIITCGMIEKK